MNVHMNGHCEDHTIGHMNASHNCFSYGKKKCDADVACRWVAAAGDRSPPKEKAAPMPAVVPPCAAYSSHKECHDHWPRCDWKNLTTGAFCGDRKKVYR